jgi:hypothetical protein
MARNFTTQHHILRFQTNHGPIESYIFLDIGLVVSYIQYTGSDKL